MANRSPSIRAQTGGDTPAHVLCAARLDDFWWEGQFSQGTGFRACSTSLRVARHTIAIQKLRTPSVKSRATTSRPLGQLLNRRLEVGSPRRGNLE
jgi:hypothetical protein